MRWDWKIDVPQLNTAVFIIPGDQVKNGDDRLVVLNSIALNLICNQKGKHATHVLTFNGKPITRMLNTAWIRGRKTVVLSQVRVHDMKHTFGRRLQSAGVSIEDRQNLLGHRSGRITTHYLAAELSRLLEAANCVCMDERKNKQPEIVVLGRLSVS